MKAIYDTSDNSLQEQSDRENPFPPPDYECYAGDIFEYNAALENYRRELKEYSAHIASLRKLPCSPEAGFKDGQVYELDKDYEVVLHYYAPDDKELRAVPLDPLKGEDEDWEEAGRIIYSYTHKPDKIMELLKGKFNIIKK
jgi:hypothetical protein